MSSPPHIAIVGAGPAGLMAGEAATRAGARVIIYDRMGSPARKFLLAGRGGLNLTHTEPTDAFLARYGAARAFLEPFLQSFPAQATRGWADELGADTFVGASGRVFPRAMKASPLLRAWLRQLASLGVEYHVRHTFKGFDDAGQLRFATPGGDLAITSTATILALGGASWPRLGADGGWVETLRARGVEVAPLRPANCGFEIAWSEPMRDKFAGAPLKNALFSFDGASLRGEAMITQYGLEGGAIYALSAKLRDAIAAKGHADLVIDTRPDVAREALTERLSAARGKQSTATFLRKAGMSALSVALAREAGPLPTEPAALAARFKALPLRLLAPRPIARAISSAGGVRLDAVDAYLMLKQIPGVFVAGEMLDWEAPTGGYLLQACFATGRAAGANAAQWARGARACGG